LAAQRFPLLGQHPKRCSRCGPESLEQPSLFASQAPRTSEFGFSGGDEMAIDARTMGHRVSVNEEDSASHDVRRGIFLSNSLNYNEQGKQQIGESGLT
jgi:hypothetical protein